MPFPRLRNATSAKLRDFFASGLELTAHDVEARCWIDVANARKYLNALHGAGEIRIKRWRRDINVGAPVPVYAQGPGKDAPRPKPVPAAQRKRALRRDPEHVIREALRKKVARMRKELAEKGVEVPAERMAVALNIL